MNRGVAFFFARLFSNKNSGLFTVRLGVSLLLAKFGVVGILGDVVGYFVRSLLGLLIEDGTFLIDIGLDAYKEGQKLDEFKKEAEIAYKKATAKLYSEAEKNEIRKQYLDIISRIGVVGNGPR